MEWVVGSTASVSRDRIAVLASMAFLFEPFIRCLIHQSQVTVKHGVPRHKEKYKHHEAKHEEYPGEGHKEVLWRQVCIISFQNISFIQA